MTYFDVTTPKTYNQNGEEKTKWLNVGTVRRTDEGKLFLELNMFPGQTFLISPSKPKEQNDRQQ